MLVISWKSGESEGYSDLLPSHWFESDGNWSYVTHAVQGPKGGRKIARCSLSVQGSIADLDYTGEHVEYNKTRFYIGTIRIIFTDTTRRDVREVQWRDAEEGSEFETVDVEAHERTMLMDELEVTTSLDLADGRKKIERMVALRQGQPAFRNALMDAYERRCAVTNCTIDDVLEAAHISPYLGEHTNRVTNGLLLRADIHTLFDRGLIKVDSNYRVTAPAHIAEQYDLPGSINLPKNPSYHPDPAALAAKWGED
jgi:hypothetical protein